MAYEPLFGTLSCSCFHIHFFFPNPKPIQFLFNGGVNILSPPSLSFQSPKNLNPLYGRVIPSPSPLLLKSHYLPFSLSYSVSTTISTFVQIPNQLISYLWGGSYSCLHLHFLFKSHYQPEQHISLSFWYLSYSVFISTFVQIQTDSIPSYGRIILSASPLFL